MRKLYGLTIVVAMSATMLIGASSAAAAVEVGSECSGVAVVSNYSMVPVALASSQNPAAAPAAGILTKWTVRSNSPTANIERLRVFRPTGKPHEFTAVAESELKAIIPGTNVFAARIPVQAGDRFGAFGASPNGPLYCPGFTGDIVDLLSEDAPVGTTKTFSEAQLQLALSATVEPDVDGDGFGDDSQDSCPRSAKTQAPCPLIALSSFGLAQKGSALILASASSQAQVTVSGTATVGKKGGKKGKRAEASAQITIPGGTKPVAAGQIIPFTLTFPPSLRSQLAATPPAKSLTLTVTTSTTDLAGQASSSQLKLKLKGQKRKGKGGGKS